MAEPVGSPLWWLDRLLKKLQKRRAEISVYDDYYEGRHPLAFASEKFLKAFGGLFESFADNWCDLVVDAVEERLNVTGFRVEANAKGDDDAWRIWQANNLDADSQMGITEALVNGLAGAIVWAGPDDQTPSITIEHPREVIVETAPGNRRQRLAALKWWTDEERGHRLRHGVPARRHLQVPHPHARREARHGRRPQRRHGQVGAARRRRRTLAAAQPAEGRHRRPIANRPRLLVPGVSEIKRVIPIQDAVNKLVSDMLVTSEFSAFRSGGRPAWTSRSIPRPTSPSSPSGRPSTGCSSPRTRTPSSASSASDLSNFVQAIEMVVQHIASQTRTPPHYFYLRGQFPSGESIKSAETGLVAKARRKMRHLGEDLEEIIRLAFAVIDDPKADEPGLETIWADPESRTEAEHVDATIKKRALKVPLLQLWEDVGYSPQQIERFKEMLVEEAALGLVDNDPDPTITSPGSATAALDKSPAMPTGSRRRPMHRVFTWFNLGRFDGEGGDGGDGGSGDGSGGDGGDGGNGGGDGGAGDGGGGSDKTFTQAQLDKIVSDRLKRQKEQFKDYDDLKSKATKFDELDAASKSDLEKANERAAEAEAKSEKATQTANQRLIRGEIIARAAQAAGERKAFLDPSDAYAHLRDNPDITVNDEGEVLGVDEALEKLAEKKPHLTTESGSKVTGDGDGGARGGGKRRQGHLQGRREGRAPSGARKARVANPVVINVRAELADGRLQLSVEGHANQAEDGRVCAAVSAVTQTALLGLEEIARLHPNHVSIEIKESPC
jgi:hypothetical protein